MAIDKTTENQTVEAAGLLVFTASDPGNKPLHPEYFLLLRHQDRWDLPKGHCEEGESLVETAMRETVEETGISAECIEPIPGFSFALEYEVTYQRPTKTTRNKRVTYFLGRVAQRCDIVCTEHQSFEWFKWAPPHRIQIQTIDPLLSAAEAFLASQSPNH